MTAARPKPLEGPRGVRLRDALLDRFRAGAKEFNLLVDSGQGERGQGELVMRTITRDSVKALVTEPDRWPDLVNLETYAAAARWTLEAVVADLGLYSSMRMRRDFGALLARHRALLRSNLTSVERGPLPASGVTRIRTPVPTDAAAPFVSAPLDELIFEGDEEPADEVALACPGWRLSARAGDCENMAYPRVPARAWLRVDRQQTAIEPGALYVLLHPRGVSVCAADDDGRTMTLLPDPASGYGAQRLARQTVTVLGRVVALAAQVGRRLPPSPPSDFTLSMFEGDEDDLAAHPARQMLTEAWRRHGRSYSEHGKRTRSRRRRVFGRRRGGQSGANMHAYISEDAARLPKPHFETLYQQAAESDVDYQDLLRAFGVAPGLLADRGPSIGADARLDALERLRGHVFGDYLEDLGWDLPWLCAVRAQVEQERIYHLGALVPGWAPLLKPGAFVVVDESARGRTVPRAAPDAWRDWERPLYLLRLRTAPRLLCGYCEMLNDDVIRAAPHPDDPEGVPRDFRRERDARVIGRVTHVATLL